jgi:hypothetical protein
MDRGVHVHFHYSPDSISGHPYAHMFRYMPLSAITAYATQFDASVVAYNTNACACADRFNTTIPDRLVASVSAGIPVAVPANGYHACREYLKNYRSVLYFRSAEELAASLADRAYVDELKEMAREDSRNYVGEMQVGPLLRIFS